MPRDQEAACAMQSPPDWPPAAGALRPSPFPHPVLHTLHDLARALLFPAYWAADQLLGYWAPAARTRSLGWLSSAAGAGAALLLLLACLPLALPGLLLWLPLQPWRRPFCYQPPPQCWTPPALWRPPADPTRCFGFLSANLCLLPHGLARFSNLPHSQRRAAAVGATLLAGLRPARYGATGCSLPPSEAPCGVLVAAVPAGLDFVCLQEVFDLRAARRLVHLLAPNLGPVLYDVGALGLQPGPHLKLLGSGLLLASRYPLLRAAFRAFPNARREDALASKGLLSAQKTGPCDASRWRWRWTGPRSSKPRAAQGPEAEAVAFSVLLGRPQLRQLLATDAAQQPLRSTTRWPFPRRCCGGPWSRREGRLLYLAGPPRGNRPEPWRGRRLDYITYREAPGSPLSPEVEQMAFSTALAGLSDHLAVGLRLRVSVSAPP
ncbi:sphingomyelin phosphodiesterase 3-like isoform X2 [Choloepus didactylus]|uniref:sphingomyelin phosphodiesterase 3-like isoform X2 n=1 Tax=Choloepus didactylus TaxID=27675 RepID=UPI00189F0F9E|nr:sphingomyelin phosphodiesterase 3-like isoform X2 [Choloepus didactylus]